jgi:TRAP-type uncharacterized transport system substrate-binding protein
MKKILLSLAAFVSLTMFGCSMQPAFAQQLKVATGGPTGTYSKMLKEVTQTCGSAVAIVEQNTSGSTENVNLLVGNQVNGAFVQTDVLHYRASSEDLTGVKTLLTLHPEEVHVLTLDVKKEAGVLDRVGLGSKTPVFNTVKDLQGATVGAVGGSFITAQVIRIQSEIAYKVVEFPDNKALIAALTAGQVNAALLVGGSPLGAIAELKGGYKLLTFPDDVTAKLKAVYRPARLNYTGINAKGVQSVATDALFVTREYKSPKFVAALGALRSCIVTNIDDLKETTGMHPKWQSVDVGNKGKWPYYELPTPSVEAAVVPTKKK